MTIDLLDPEAALRFWVNIDVTEPDVCWRWSSERGAREQSGHVRIWHQSVRIYAHRLAFLLSGGHLPEGMFVLHSCDVGDCCNPQHLRAGTALDNARDRDLRGRRTPQLPRGESHWSAKLTNLEASAIRVAYSCGVRADDLARQFGVCRGSIYNIVGGVTYAERAS